MEIKGLTINNHFVEKTDLIKLCERSIKFRQIPNWQIDIYSFILNFLDNSVHVNQKTSGSTGEPKTIELPKKLMVESAKATISFFKLKKSDSALLCLPIKYIAGKMMVVRALLGELNLLLVEPSSAPDIPNTGKIDFCAMVPMQAMNLLNRGKWPNIKIVIIGGAKTNPELVRKIKNIDTVIYETYGMAETCSHIALKPLNGKNADIHFSILPQVKIDTDIRGCLTIEWEILPEKLITNDYVEIISENKFKWLGRYDNIINSGGIKIQPETLETQFSEILGIPCVLIGKADPILGEQIVMILESTIKINTNSVLKKLNPLFEKKILPKSIICLNKFPRNKSFKIDRILLKKLINT